MTKKSKKLGVKTTKTAVFDDDQEGVNKTGKDKQEDELPAGTSSTSTHKSIDLSQLCSTLDKLTIDLLILMQQHIQQKLNMEKSMTDGELHLSKSRYIMGHKNVSALQLPVENSADIDPSITLEEIIDDKSMFGKPRLKLNIENFAKPDSEDEKSNVQDPVKWFGVLVPRDLRSAQSKFKDAITWAVDCANTQIKMHQTCVKIKQLTQLKNELRETDEE